MLCTKAALRLGGMLACLVCLPLAAEPPAIFPSETDLPRVILGEEGRRLSAAGDAIYVAGLGGRSASRYYLIRPGPALAHERNRRTGRSSIYLGQARVASGGDPAVLTIETSRREIRPGDYLLAIEEGARQRHE
ncbi:hypothetical protein [Spiribacter insolitus]|uniref:Uncharacterized protein n=1 Tax=Spiribacter insolitus TaxID=3122417 RepID=A0ABV3TBZ9_9GAMM